MTAPQPSTAAKPKRMTIGLCRVSSDKDQSPASQRAAIATYAAARGWTVDRWLGDKDGDAISGGAEHHPDIDTILELATEKGVERLLATAQARIGRRGPATSLIIEQLVALGVEIHLTQEG